MLDTDWLPDTDTPVRFIRVKLETGLEDDTRRPMLEFVQKLTLSTKLPASILALTTVTAEVTAYIAYDHSSDSRHCVVRETAAATGLFTRQIGRAFFLEGLYRFLAIIKII